MASPVRDTVLNLVLAALQERIISSDDLRECTQYIDGKDMSSQVRSNAISLIESALERGVLDVSDLQSAATSWKGSSSLWGSKRGKGAGGRGGSGYGGGFDGCPEAGIRGGFEGAGRDSGPSYGKGLGGRGGFGKGSGGRGGFGKGSGGRGGFGKGSGGRGGFGKGSGGRGGYGKGSGGRGRRGNTMFGEQSLETRPGDWLCVKCNNSNFSWRTECNISTCKAPKPEKDRDGQYNPYDVSGQGFQVFVNENGDWMCPKCNNVNFAWRKVCNGHGCDQKKNQ